MGFRSFRNFRHIRRAPAGRTGLCIGLAALAVVAGCTAMPTETADQTRLRQVIETVYENIDKRYADDATMRSISLAGLKGLSETDTLVQIHAEPDRVALHYDDRILGEWPAPPAYDFDRWAALSSSAITLARAESATLAKTDSEQVLKRFFSGGLAELDRYTRYSTPDQARNTRARREGFGGLGVTIRYENGETFVRQVHDGTPAFKSGMMAGDRITHIGETGLSGLSQRDVIRKLRGPIHSRAELTVAREGVPHPLKISVIRAHIILPTVTSELEDRILTIRISGFNQGTSRSLGKVLSSAERNAANIQGIVMDLRGNPGGLLDQAVAVADFFLNDGRIISTRGRHRRANQVFDATWGERVHRLPIVLLVNGRSASASEIVAAALRDRGRAIIVGASSFGKGSVQTIIRLPNSGELTLTWAHMIAPSGFNLQGHGVVPAVCTSGSEPEFNRLMEAVESGETVADKAISAILAARFAIRNDPEGARKACPPSRKERAEDLAIARYILNHRSVYGQALKDGAPTIAQR